MTVWTKERIEKLPLAEIRSLRENASERGAHDVVTLCETVLGTKLKPAVVGAKRKTPPTGHPRLISRSKAMEMRGVKPSQPALELGRNPGVGRNAGAHDLGTGDRENGDRLRVPALGS